MLREETAEEGMLVEDTEKVETFLILILPLFLSLVKDTWKVEPFFFLILLLFLISFRRWSPFSSLFFFSFFFTSSQESVATDEGFHDESTNDTDPLVKKNNKRR